MSQDYLFLDKFNDIENADKGQLRLLRNEIFARHGHDFESKDLISYFLEKSWYQNKPNHKVQLTELSTKEKEILKLIIEYEKSYEVRYKLKYLKKFTIELKIDSLLKLNEIAIQYTDDGILDFDQFKVDKFIPFTTKLYIYKSTLGKEKDKVEKTYSAWYDSTEMHSQSVYKFDSLVVILSDTYVYQIITIDKSYSTPDGFAVGKPIDFVSKKYPEIILENSENGILYLQNAALYMELFYLAGFIVLLKVGIVAPG